MNTVQKHFSCSIYMLYNISVQIMSTAIVTFSVKYNPWQATNFASLCTGNGCFYQQLNSYYLKLQWTTK